jgi:PLP dependent protein
VRIQSSFAAVEHVIAESCERAGRARSEITLVAVTKTRSLAEIAQILACGVRHLGENRADEAIARISAVQGIAQEPVIWHMIGHIQGRKARDVAHHFDMVHSLDRVSIAGRLASVRDETAEPLPCLMQVNITGEPTKFGFPARNWESDPDVLQALVAGWFALSQASGIRVEGLMTMAPIVSDPEDARWVFASLRRLRTALEDATGRRLPELSMGMSDDYPVAIEEGATMVRIGRALFDQPA